MIWWGYNLLFGIGFVLMLPHFLLRMKRRGGYRRGFGQRLGWYDAATRADLARGGWFWVHAVSVGELFIALQLMKRIRMQRSDVRFLVTTTTSTGFSLAKKRLPNQDRILYFPVDAPWIMKRVVQLVKPERVVLVEYELWPNLIRRCARSGVSVALVNGRLSERSYRGYRKLRVFTRRLLPMVGHCCMQGEKDAERIKALGAVPEQVHVVGSAKYEVPERDPEMEQRIGSILQGLDMGRDRLIWVGGSTWPGEEEVLLRIFQRVRAELPDLRLVLVPRHVERAAAIEAELSASGCTYVRRSEAETQAAGSSPDVLFVDTTGELRHFYAHADLIFVGKSLTRTEGQNIVEPAAYGKSVVVGPRLDNFEAIVQDFQQANAFCQVADEAELCAVVQRLMLDPEARREMGERAAALVRQQAGALDRTLALICPN